MPNYKYLDFKNNYLSLKKHGELVFAGKITNETMWQEQKHEHIDSCEIALVVNGSGTTQIGNNLYTVSRGNLLVYNARVTHSERLFSSTEPLVLYYVVIRDFSLEDTDENQLIPTGVSPILGSGKEYQALKHLFEVTLNECEIQDQGYEVVTNSLLKAIIIKVIRLINDQYQLLLNDVSEKSLEIRIKEYIEKNYMKNLTLKYISKQFFISHYYLEHIFKQYCGDSPINYMIKLRIESAKKLLESTELSVKTITTRAGYASVPYFCVSFKKVIGMTPTEYRDIKKKVAVI